MRLDRKIIFMEESNVHRLSKQADTMPTFYKSL